MAGLAAFAPFALRVDYASERELDSVATVVETVVDWAT